MLRALALRKSTSGSRRLPEGPFEWDWPLATRALRERNS